MCLLSISIHQQHIIGVLAIGVPPNPHESCRFEILIQLLFYLCQNDKVLAVWKTIQLSMQKENTRNTFQLVKKTSGENPSSYGNE